MIKIICVGKLKESFWKDAVLEYKKRIGKYHKIEIVELADSNKDNESDLIISKINVKDYNILLDIKGSRINSLDFANKIDGLFINYSNITFIIGGSDGVNDKVRDMINFRLSFSDMTFPHQLFRVMLLEQIYRCFKINNNETYHK